ncbi:MAG: hypothetical protein GC182_08400 [Rhodopseudomonas sp.]|nr:hypothetical protein [Rhodopseudomonas sp.]
MVARRDDAHAMMQRLRDGYTAGVSFDAVDGAARRLDQNLATLEKTILQRTQLRARLEAKQAEVQKVHGGLSAKLTPIVDDSYFEVVSAADEIGKGGNRAILSLINGGIRRLHAILDLGAETNMMTGLLAAGTASMSPPMLAQLRQHYQVAAERARRLLSRLPDEPEFRAMRTQIDALLKAGEFKRDEPVAAPAAATPALAVASTAVPPTAQPIPQADGPAGGEVKPAPAAASAKTDAVTPAAVVPAVTPAVAADAKSADAPAAELAAKRAAEPPTPVAAPAVVPVVADGSDRLKEVFRAHESLTGILVKLVDDLNFRLMMNGQDAARKSSSLLKTLVDKQIVALRNALETSAQTHLLTTLLSEGATARELDQLAPVQDRFKAAASLLRKVSASLTDPAIKKSIDELIAFGTDADGVFGLRAQELAAGHAANESVKDNLAIQHDLDQAVAALVKTSEAGMKSSEGQLLASLDRYRQVLIGVALISVLAAGGIGIFYVQRKLVRPLSAIDGSIGRLARQIVATIVDIRSAAAEVARSATEISTSTGDLSQRTEEHAASLEQTSASMEEMATTVTRNAENAKHADVLAKDTRAVADRGGAVVAKTIGAMARIEESSGKMSDIISVIDEVARQTNLLALNAAVEAARAGDAGRGFAVVASEVRSLAQRSSQAAKDIRGLITNSAAQVKEGVELVNATGAALKDVVASIQKVTDVVAAIASASHEQSAGIDQINRSLAQMDEVTQQNSALVEQNAATAKTLEWQATQMDERISVLQRDAADEDDRVEPVAKAATARPVAKRPVPMTDHAGKRTGTHG